MGAKRQMSGFLARGEAVRCCITYPERLQAHHNRGHAEFLGDRVPRNVHLMHHEIDLASHLLSIQSSRAGTEEFAEAIRAAGYGPVPVERNATD